MPPPPHLSPDDFRALAARFADWIATYHDRVESLPVLSPLKPGDILNQLPKSPPADGLASWDPIFHDLDAIILPGLTHWQSPNFFGFYPCNASGPAILGEFLSAGLNIIGMLWATSPAATELEIRVLDWLAQMLALPPQFHSTGTGGGCIQGTASESTLIALVAARHRVTVSLPHSVTPSLTLYTSAQSHSSVIKAAMVAGLARAPEDRTHLRLIDTDSNHAMRPDLLEAAIREDLQSGRLPFFVCATVGTTSTAAIDPVDKIAAAIRAAAAALPTPPWLHVDAAYAGAACICPEFRPMLAGIEHAESLCFNPHKWLLTNFDCDAFWVADKRTLTDALSITPEYLRNPASESGQVTDFRDWQVPLGRRFRALKLWFVIRHYGVAGLQAHIREHTRLAALFEQLLTEDTRFELAASRSLSLVTFRLRPKTDSPESAADADARTRELLARLNASGKLFLTHTTLRDARGRQRYTLRLAIGATHTQERHIREAWSQIRTTADAL